MQPWGLGFGLGFGLVACSFFVGAFSSNPVISLPPCRMLYVDVANEVSWQTREDFSCLQNDTQPELQISFCHYRAYNSFTARQSNFNELPETIKASFLQRDLREYQSDVSLAAPNQSAFQPRCHFGFLVCQKSLQDAAAGSSNQHASTWRQLMGLNWYVVYFTSYPWPETPVRISAWDIKPVERVFACYFQMFPAASPEAPHSSPGSAVQTQIILT